MWGSIPARSTPSTAAGSSQVLGDELYIDVLSDMDGNGAFTSSGVVLGVDLIHKDETAETTRPTRPGTARRGRPRIAGHRSVRAVNPVATPMSRRSAMAAHWLAQGPASRDDRGGALRKSAAIATLPGTSSPLPQLLAITGRLQDLSL